MIVAVATQKGGSAKTTTVVNLGAALAERSRRTLLVDLDGQAHTTYWLLGASGRGNGPFVQDWLEQRCPSEAVVRSTAWPNLDVIPGNLALNHLRDRLEPARRAADARVLRDPLRELAASYSWVLVDCPAGLNSLTINALVAADRLLIPVAPPDSISTDGTQHMLTTARRISETTNPGLRLLGVLIANAQLRRATERRQVERLRSAGFPVFSTAIQASGRMGTAAEAHRPALAQAPSSTLAAAYRALAAEVEAMADQL